VVGATVTVVAGVLAGVIATATPRPARTAADAASTASSSPVAETTPSAASATATSPTPDVGVVLPASNPLAGQQFIIPRGEDGATQLNLANIAGVVGPRRLSNAGGRNSWPMLSADRRTIIYINYAAGTLRTIAADGTGDRRLITSQPKNCGEITRASWSPADQSIMVVECRAEDRPDRLLVIKLDGTVVRQLETNEPRVEDPMISPDGRTVTYWAAETADRPNGGSIYTLAMDGSSPPVQLTDRKAGSDADPTWSPDGTMIAFRRRVSADNFDVYLMRADGSGVRPVATGPAVEEKPSWSPDGRQMMIISNRDESGEPGKTYDAYVLDVDGGAIRPLGLSANVVLTPAWSYR
jgi:TolB protein